MATGYGQAVSVRSLAGIVARPNAGFIEERPDAAITVNPGIELLHSNPRRVWAIIQNTGTITLQLSLDTNTGIAPLLELRVGGSFQIDSNTPWTGPVYLGGGAGGAATYIEVSIQE